MANLTQLILNNSDRVQSPYLFLDVAGSDGTDGSAEGFHLRWDLLRGLGDSHLPKGNLAAPGGVYEALPGAGYNKPDDFVQIFRIPYTKRYQAIVDFVEDKPRKIVESGKDRRWEYDIVIDDIAHTSVTTTVIIRFPEINKYDAIRSKSSTLDPIAFLKQFKGRVEVEAKDKLSFVVRIRVKQDAPAAGLTRVETISLQDNLPSDKGYISIRKKFNFNSADRLPEPSPDWPVTDDIAFLQANCLDEYALTAENIKYVRFDYNNVYPIEIKLETYADYIMGVSGEEETWESVGTNDGKYALSVTDSEVFERLEKTTDLNIDAQWPRYRPGDAPVEVEGADGFKVNVDNYKNKWTKAEGLKQAVTTYLDHSRDGSAAIITHTLDDATNADQDPETKDVSTYDLNYLDALQQIGLDYHVARMFGLGCIDNQDLIGNIGNRRYVYLSIYKTIASLESGQVPTPYTHYYMSLPLRKQDYRLPLSPIMKDLSYGVSFGTEQGAEVPIEMTDPDGYVKYERLRFININVEAQDQYPPVGTFFSINNEFNFAFVTETAFYGIEYKGKKDNGDWEDYYRIAKLQADNNYFDHSGNKEVELSYASEAEDSKKVFTHGEREQGFHRYATYAVNWFSRISVLSNQKDTETIFTEAVTMLPPVNLAAQIIQKEDVLLFTTSIEQQKLLDLQNTPETDPTLVRATFYVNDTHHSNHQVTDKVQFCFKEDKPTSIAGMVMDPVDELAGKRVQFKTKSFTIQSDGSMTVVDPVISSEDITKYLGSVFATQDQNYFIEDIFPDPANGNRAKIKIKLVEKRDSMEIEPGSDIFVPAQSYVAPVDGAQFLVVENLQKTENWDKKLAKEVDVINFSPTQVQIIDSTGNNGTYTCKTQHIAINDTDIYFQETLPSAIADGKLRYPKKVCGDNVFTAEKAFIVAGEFAQEILVGSTVRIENSLLINGSYTVNSVQALGDFTKVIVNEAIAATDTRFAMVYTRETLIKQVNQGLKKITVKGDITEELRLMYSEIIYFSDGRPELKNVGGIFEEATITAIPDVENTSLESGAYNIVFTSYNLSDHPDADVEWYNGTVRIPVANSDILEYKTLEVIQIKRGTPSSSEVGAILTPLHIVAYDATFNQTIEPEEETVPPTPPTDMPRILLTPASVRTLKVNFHPGYRVYLKAETGFNSDTLLPLPGDEKKETLLSARTYDSVFNNSSYLAQGALLYAKEIIVPLPPGIPSGPTFATRPDFFGRSTYTFDVTVNTDNNRIPYALIFYRSNSRNILDTLYKQETVQQVLQDLANLTPPDSDFYVDRWRDFVNANLDENGLFKEHTPGGYRMPNPDNSNLEVINLSDPNLAKVNPFNADGSTTPGSVYTYLKQAIDGSFDPLTEQPILYQPLRDEAANGGRFTRNTRPVIKDINGNYIFPPNPNYDQAPMAVKFNDGESKVRFTDYTLEGSSNEVYFYYGQEMSNNLELSARSTITDPILLVDSSPASAPVIKKVTTQLANPIQDIPTAINFEIDPYVESQRIKKLQLYRTIDEVESLTVRTMTPVKEFVFDPENPVNVVEISDDFEGEAFPPYGELLFYRVVAMREIKNEQNLPELTLSEPSDLVMTNIVDVFNPLAPDISYNADELTDFPRRLTKVKLTWNKTVHNGTYYLFKMSTSGNFVRIADINSNDAVVSYTLPGELIKQDEDGNQIYHRFKVDVENSSGLLNLQSKEITI